MSELTKWLARTPQPATVRVERGDGEVKPVRVGVTRSKWRDAESAIGSDWVRLEAVDESGALLRAWESETAEETRTKNAPLPASPQEVMLARFAELLANACDQAVQRHTEFVNVAFMQLGSLVQLYAQRNAMLEKAWHRLLVDSARAQAEAQPDASDAVIGGIMQMGMAQLAAKEAAPKSKGKPNGS